MPTLLKGRYEIIETLGAGGFGETFLAVDTHLPSKRKCVIKHFKPKQQLDPATFQLVRERFEREAAVLESLSESCNQIPRLYAYFVEEGEYYLVQELIEGKTIKQKVAADGRFSEEGIRQLLTSILLPLDQLHNKGVIHRDIKPDNIILRHRDGLPVLIDFGAVKEIVTTVVDEYGTPVNPSIVIGTPGYTPPEQTAGRPVFASDLYSLAMTAIFAATGKEPQQLTDSTTKQINWEGEAIKINSNLQTVLNTSIQPDYRHRYASAQKMLKAIEAVDATDSQRTILPRPNLAVSSKRLLSGLMIAMILLAAAAIGGYYSALITGNHNNVGIPAPTKFEPKSDDADAYNNRGNAYFNKSDYDQAIAEYGKAIDLKPDYVAAHYNRGLAYSYKGEHERAIANYNKVVELKPRFAVAYYSRGISYVYTNDHDRAIASYDKAIELKPDFAAAYYGRYAAYGHRYSSDRAIESYNKLVRLMPNSADVYYNRANAHLRYSSPRLDLAIADYSKAIEIKSDNADAYFNRGLVYHYKRDYDLAIMNYDKAIEHKSNDADVYCGRGNAYYYKLNYNSAIADYSKAIELKPDFAIAFYNRGNAYDGKGDYDRAIADHKKAVELRPDFADADNKRKAARDHNTNYNVTIDIGIKPNHGMVLLKPLTALQEE